MAFFSFGEFEFDERKGILLHDGESRNLRPQSAQLLKLLLDNSGRTVTKEEIITQVWDGEFISDQVLFQCMNDLRKALGETAKEPRFIRTIPRKGYRWIHRKIEVISTAQINALTDIAPPEVSISPIPPKKHYWKPALISLTIVLCGWVLWSHLKSTGKGTQVLICAFENQTGDSGKNWIKQELQNLLVQELNAAFSEEHTVQFAGPLDHVPDSEEISKLLAKKNVSSLFLSQLKQYDSEVRLDYQFFSQDRETQTGTVSGRSLSEIIGRYSAMIDYFISKRKLDHAESYLDRFTAVSDENNSEIAFYKGLILYERGNFKAAVKSIEKARKLAGVHWQDMQQENLEISQQSATDGKKRTLINTSEF